MTTKLLPSRNVLMGIVRIALIVLFATQLLSCTDEYSTTPTPNGEEKTITFSVKVPGGFTPATYTLTPSDEAAVNTVDVLLFKSDDKTFVSGPHYGAINGTSVTVRIPEGTADYDMVILANCRGNINDANLSSLVGSDKEAVLDVLTKSIDAGDGESGSKEGGTDAGWITTGTDTSIPMWAEIAVSVTGTSATVNGGNNYVSLVRMLSRITVRAGAVNVTVAGKTAFNLAEIYLCNYNDEGRIAPDAANWSAENGVSTAPTAIGSKIIEADKSIKYTVTGDNSLYDVYAFETETESSYDAQNPCIVVAGTFDSESNKNFYRIDLVKEAAGSTSYLALLRNHSYDITISKISGSGAATLSAALSSPPAGIETSVMQWNDNTIGTIVVDNMVLGVSQGSFAFDAAARDDSDTDNTLIVVTENISSNISVVPNDTWFDVELQEDDAATPKRTYSYKLKVDANETGTPRAGTIKISVNLLEYEVSVTQDNKLSVAAVPQPQANSYILAPNNRDGIAIPVSHAYRALDVIEGNSPTAAAYLPAGWFGSGEFMSELIWKDNENLSFKHLVIGTGKDAYLNVRVTSTGQSGNAVIGIRKLGATDADGFLWSWHIWVTDYTPTNAGSGFMDRNLGALSATPADPATKGLYYQWGRKDPFPANKSVWNNTEAPIFVANDHYAVTAASDKNIKKVSIENITDIDLNANKTTYAPPIETANNNLDYAVANPHIFYFTTATLYDWYTPPVDNSTITQTIQNNNLWGGYLTEVSSKTVYDPCPPGWRIPKSSKLGTGGYASGNGFEWATNNASSWSNASAENSVEQNESEFNNNKGYTWNSSGAPTMPNYGGYYPAAGARSKDAGNAYNVSKLGYYWSASPYTATGNHQVGYMLFTENTVNPIHYSIRSAGSNVRCIQDREIAPSPLPVSINKATYYPRTGNTEKFFITSSTGADVEWKIKKVLTVGSGVGISHITQSGTASNTTSTDPGNIVEFTTDNNPENNIQVIVTLSSPDGTNEINVTLNIGGTYTPSTHAGWAGNNIYYDETRQILTFDDSPVTSDKYYQGLYFRWGSLWGVSPRGNTENSFSYVQSSTIIYKATLAGITTTGAPEISTWNEIPYINTDPGVYSRNRAYLYEQTGVEILGDKVGDICKWLTDKGWAPNSERGTRWRMPISSEFEVSSSSYVNSEGVFTEDISTLDNGTHILLNGNPGKYKDSGPFFPASGLRNSNGNIGNIGTTGYYWSSSPAGSEIAYRLYFTSGVNANDANRKFAFPIRCVKDL